MAKRRQSRQVQAAAPLILDSGAVIALARGDQRARAFVARALETGADQVSLMPVVAAIDEIDDAAIGCLKRPT